MKKFSILLTLFMCCFSCLMVGCGKKDEPMTVKVGDKILYGKYSGTEINIEGTDYLIMRENDIYAII